MELEGSSFLTSDYSTKPTVIKTVWYWQKNRNIDQWNKTESPEICPYICGTLSLTKEEYTMEKRQSLQYVVLGKLESYMQKNKRTLLTANIKINSKWIKDLNVRPETIKLLEEM